MPPHNRCFSYAGGSQANNAIIRNWTAVSKIAMDSLNQDDVRPPSLIFISSVFLCRSTHMQTAAISTCTIRSVDMRDLGRPLKEQAEQNRTKEEERAYSGYFLSRDNDDGSRTKSCSG